MIKLSDGGVTLLPRRTFTTEERVVEREDQENDERSGPEVKKLKNTMTNQRRNPTAEARVVEQDDQGRSGNKDVDEGLDLWKVIQSSGSRKEKMVKFVVERAEAVVGKSPSTCGKRKR